MFKKVNQPKNELNITRNGKQRTRNRKKELEVNQ
ncbi:hypothetical protein NC651_039187 [Populus alba x Populus x berolinensis]|nr:hypothetical protein NC651_039187 [Populus alba x Populus x berolinensis]